MSGWMDHHEWGTRYGMNDSSSPYSLLNIMIRLNTPSFTIQKALQFVGDNSTYQKRRLLILSSIIFLYAMLTCRISLYSEESTLLFLFSSGAGQLLCPLYLSLRTEAMCLGAACLLASTSALLPQVLPYVYCAMGFFGRGFFVSSLIYLNEIGGDKFRAWSMVVVFAIWGLAPVIQSFQRVLKIPPWVWTYGVVILPFLLCTYMVLSYIEPSPLSLHSHPQSCKRVLNQIARENNRGMLPYDIETQPQDQPHTHPPSYSDVINKPLFLNITLPLIILWIYRQYIYYTSYILLPQLGHDLTKNLILFSISETLAVLMSYPIRLKVKRINAFSGFIFLIACASLLSSFTTIDEECMQSGQTCPTKYIYRVSIMLIRFSIALIGNLLISYTMEIYPTDVKKIGFSLCLAASAVGSTLMPWVNGLLITTGMSGFIGFVIASAVALLYVSKMQETNGKMSTLSLREIQNKTPMVPLESWVRMNF